MVIINLSVHEDTLLIKLKSINNKDEGKASKRETSKLKHAQIKSEKARRQADLMNIFELISVSAKKRDAARVVRKKFFDLYSCGEKSQFECS